MIVKAPPGSVREKVRFIQVWRGIAVLLVVYYHFTNRVPPEYLGMATGPSIIFYSGKLGVLIFFVISGYLITKSLGQCPTLANFYAKRISRIWPLFILASLTIFLFLQFAEPPVVPDGPKRFFTEDRSWLDLLGSLFFLEDLGFRWMDGVFWSVLVELKFYFWIGLLACLRPSHFVRDFALLAILLGVLEMTIALTESDQLSPLGRVLNGLFVAQYLPYFAIGALLFAGTNRDLLTILLILALVHAALKSASNPDFELQGTAIFGLCLAGIVMLDAIFLKSRIFLHLGDHSYSFYLFHQIIGLSIIKMLGGTVNYDIALIAALIFTYAIAVIASWAAEWRFRMLFTEKLLIVLSSLGLNRLRLPESHMQRKPAAR